MTAREGDTSLPPAREGALNDRAARVFEFLVEMQRLRTKVVRFRPGEQRAAASSAT